MAYLGDFDLGTTLYTKFTTVNASGVPTELSAPACALYSNATTTAFLSGGLSCDASWNSYTGLNHVQMTLTTSATGITSGGSYQIVLATGTVSAVNLKGYVIGEFSIRKRSALMPATAGQTIVVDANGIAAANVTSMSASGIADLFLTNSGTTYASATAGSLVTEIAVNAGTLTVQDIIDGVWDEPGASHTGAGSLGEELNSAGAAADPWATAIPGAYTAAQAGFIVGSRVDVSVGSRLAPSVAGRTLAVASTGGAAIDWANVGNPGSTVNLSATTLFAATNANVSSVSTIFPANVTSASTNIGAVITASSINIGAVVTSINTIAPARVTAQGIDIGAIVTAVNTIVPSRPTALAATLVFPANITSSSINVGAVVTAVNTIVPARVTAQGIDIGAIVTAFNTIAPAKVTSFSASGLAQLFTIDSGETYGTSVSGSPVKEIADNAGGTSLTVQAIASGVWDAEITVNTNPGSFGEELNSLGAGADPWAVAIPGAYTAASAGFLVGNRVDVSVGSRLAPAVVGRTLAVASTGGAAIDWANVGNPGSTVNLTATTLFTTTNVTNGVNVTSISTIAPARITAQGINVGAIVTTFNTIANANVTSIGAVALSAVVSGVWDELGANHTNAGSLGEEINSLGAGADPWAVAIPGAYTAASAGFIVGNRVDVSVGSRLAAGATVASVSVLGTVSANVIQVASVSVTGFGTVGSPWGP